MSNLKVKVSADSTAFSGGLNAAEKKAMGFKSSLANVGSSIKSSFASAGASIAGALAIGTVVNGAIGLISKLIDKAGALADASAKLGVDVESLQKVSRLAALGGVQMEALAKAIRKAQAAAFDASNGNTKLGESFSYLNISAVEFQKMPLEEQLLAVSQGMNEAGNATKANEAFLSIFGEKALALLPLISQDAETLKAALANIKFIDKDTIAQLDEAGDQIDSMKEDFMVMAAGPVVSFLIGLRSVVAVLGDLKTNTSDWLELLKAGATWDFKNFGEVSDRIKERAKENISEVVNGGNSNSAEEELSKGIAAAQDKAEGGSGKEKESLKEKNDKRVKEKAFEMMALEKKRAVLLGEIEQSRARATNAQTEDDREAFRERVLNAQDQLAAVEKSIESEKEAKEKALMEEHDTAIALQLKEAEARAKNEADKKKKEGEEAKKLEVKNAGSALEEEEKKLADMEANRFRVSNTALEDIGGGYANVDYGRLTESLSAEDKALQKQKETVDYLRKIFEQVRDNGPDGVTE